MKTILITGGTRGIGLAIAKKYLDKYPEKLKIKNISPKYHEIVQIENTLISLLGTKVGIQRNKKGKGKIYIEFYNENDLQRILAILTDTDE